MAHLLMFSIVAFLSFFLVMPKALAAEAASWAWVSLASQSNEWSISKGVAEVAIDKRGRRIKLLAPEGAILTTMSGKIIGQKKKNNRRVYEENLSVVSNNEGTEAGQSVFSGKKSHVSVGGHIFRDVIILEDGFNIIALTRESN